MMRAAGLTMILLGGLGIGVSLVDWQTIGDFRADDDVQEKSETLANDAQSGKENDRNAQAEGMTQAALDQTDLDQTDLEMPPVTEPETGPPEPAASASLTERDPANVRVFEVDERSADEKTTLWADISAGSDVVTEGSGHASFLVTLSEPAERSVVIIFSTVALSANDQEDYRSQRGTVTFEPGVVSAEIRTPLVDDDIKENDEEFAIVLNGAPGIVSFKSRRITTTIRDDD